MSHTFLKLNETTLKVTTTLTQEKIFNINDLLATKQGQEDSLIRFDFQVTRNAEVQAEQRLTLLTNLNQTNNLIAQARDAGITVPSGV